MKTNPYDKLLSRKRKWTPVKPKAGAFKNGAEEAIRRCLAIRHMELPVGEFIKEGLDWVDEETEAAESGGWKESYPH